MLSVCEVRMMYYFSVSDTGILKKMNMCDGIFKPGK